MRRVFVFVAAAVVVAALVGCTPKEPVEIGASCSAGEKIEACAIGKLAVCVHGKWEASLICPEGCERRSIGHGSTAPICETATADDGMACTGDMNNVCSTDGHAQLVCKGRRWKTQKACPTRCTFPKTGIVCE